MTTTTAELWQAKHVRPKALTLNSIKKVSHTFDRPANTTAYADTDCISTDASGYTGLLSVPGVSDLGGGSGRILRVKLYTETSAVPTTGFTVWFFSEPYEVVSNDNQTFALGGSPGNEDEKKVLCIESLTVADHSLDALFSGNGQIYVKDTDCAFQLAEGVTALNYALQINGTMTPGSSQEFHLELTIDSNT